MEEVDTLISSGDFDSAILKINKKMLKVEPHPHFRSKKYLDEEIIAIKKALQVKNLELAKDHYNRFYDKFQHIQDEFVYEKLFYTKEILPLYAEIAQDKIIQNKLMTAQKSNVIKRIEFHRLSKKQIKNLEKIKLKQDLIQKKFDLLRKIGTIKGELEEKEMQEEAQIRGSIKQVLEDAKQLFYNDKLTDAIILLKKILEIMPDYKEAKELLKECNEGKNSMDSIELRETLIKNKIEQINHEIGKLNYKNAMLMVNQVLDIDSENLEAKAIKKEISQYI